MSVEDWELIILPTEQGVWYSEDRHAYHRMKEDGTRGKRLTGVSTVCAPLDFKPDGLLRWAERLTLAGACEAFSGSEFPSDPYVVRSLMEARGLRYEQQREDAATRGTNVHEQMLHALATGDDIPDLASLPEEQRGYGQAVMKWWMDNEPEVLQAEQVVLSEEHGFAGRFDLRCRVKASGRLVMCDLKTSRFISAKAHAQVAGYMLGALESGFGDTDRGLIIQVFEDGTYAEIDVQADEQDFIDALTVYRASGRINGAAQKARKAEQLRALEQAA